MFESEPRVQLKYRRLWQMIGGLLVLLVVYLSLTPAPVVIPIAEGDKYGHMGAYATLMLWFALIYPLPTARLAWALAFSAMGMTLECLQGLTSYRTFDLADVAANILGVFIGWLLAPPRLPHALEFLETRVISRS